MPQCPRCQLVFVSKNDEKYRQKAKKAYPNAFEPWSVKDDTRLAEMLKEGKGLIDMVAELGRNPFAIKKRLEMYGLALPVTTTAPAGAVDDHQKYLTSSSDAT